MAYTAQRCGRGKSNAMKFSRPIHAAALALICALPAAAHHSFAVFDTAKSVTITGVVKDFQYTNPHCWIDVDVMQPNGSTIMWGFEGGPPSMMRTMGWHYNTLKPGDRITVVSHPHRDGKLIGSITSLTLPNGTVMGRRAPAGK